MKVALQPKVAIVHDYFREFGGGERVVEVLHEMFPDAPVYTASFYPKGLGKDAERFRGWDIRVSWFNKWHLPNRLISPFRIFAPSMFESFDLKEYNLVISSSNVYFSKAVKTRPGALHISYIHTPPRYLYGYTTSFNYKKHWWTRVIGELMNHILRIYDFQTSQKPDILVANSKNVQQRIKKFYRRDSVVIYPPVDLAEFKGSANNGKRGYFLSLNRLVRGKGTEITVEACTKLNLHLKVAGSGPELERLKKIAGKTIEFIGGVSDLKRVELMKNAKALIVASEDEDFGITSVEAQAAGTPVIAVKAGGYLETIIEGKTGLFFDEPTVDPLSKVLQSFEQSQFKEEDLKKNAEKFSKENFKKEMLELMKKFRYI